MILEGIEPVNVIIEGAIPETIPTDFIKNVVRGRLGLRPQDTVTVRRVEP